MIEFLEEPHIYLWDGVITPSVTQFIREMTGQGNYNNVPLSVLNNKSEYGTKMHDWLETYMLYGIQKPLDDPVMQASADQFAQMVKLQDIRLILTETIVGYNHAVCGKFDLLAERKGKLTLIDYKTTYKYEAEYLSWQLSIYALAVKETFGYNVEALGCIWLPKGKDAEYKTVKRKEKEEIDRLIAEYDKKHNAD